MFTFDCNISKNFVFLCESSLLSLFFFFSFSRIPPYQLSHSHTHTHRLLNNAVEQCNNTELCSAVVLTMSSFSKRIAFDCSVWCQLSSRLQHRNFVPKNYFENGCERLARIYVPKREQFGHTEKDQHFGRNWPMEIVRIFTLNHSFRSKVRLRDSPNLLISTNSPLSHQCQKSSTESSHRRQGYHTCWRSTG